MSWPFQPPPASAAQLAASGNDYALAADPGAFAVAGQPAAVRRSYGFACTAAGFSIAGQGAGFSRSLGRISEVVAFGLAGMTASARLARRLSAGAGVFALGGQAVAGGAHPTASPLYATELGIQLGF